MNTKRKLVEGAVGAAVGAAIAGPAGALAGAFVGTQAATHTAHVAESNRTSKTTKGEADDPIIHAQLNRILVPLDFSSPSRGALRFAREWATRFGSEIFLLHVLEPINTIPAFGAETIAPSVPREELQEQARAELEKLAREEFHDSVKVSVRLRDGAPYEQIAAAATELKADLIIIATHGRKGLSHVLLGSTAECVVRHAPCPVLTLRRAPRD
jgi:nucleotide-binding universal stress UspA family protein